MTRRSKPYLIKLGSDQDFNLSASEWNELISLGWIEPAGYKTARPRRGVVAWVRGGDLWLAPIVRMPSVTAQWFLLWLFRSTVIPATWIGDSLIERRERVAIEREREAQNEALLWRTFRGTKGANEFRWIPAERKAEYLNALRPEIIQPAVEGKVVV
jgi:hypothetical protein